jgi:hypothetical protein
MVILYRIMTLKSKFSVACHTLHLRAQEKKSPTQKQIKCFCVVPDEGETSSPKLRVSYFQFLWLIKPAIYGEYSRLCNSDSRSKQGFGSTNNKCKLPAVLEKFYYTLFSVRIFLCSGVWRINYTLSTTAWTSIFNCFKPLSLNRLCYYN